MTARQAGFTLVEALAAFAILAVSLAAVYPLLGNGRAVEDAAVRRLAVLLAQSRLAAVGGGDLPLEDGVREGRFDNGWDWRVTVAPYAELTQGPVLGKAVSATVRWPAGQEVTLTTVKLRPTGGSVDVR